MKRPLERSESGEITVKEAPMTTVDEAKRLILERTGTLAARNWVLFQSLGLVLADPIVADRDSPPFEKALVDGYAIRSSDYLGADQAWRVGERIVAGAEPSLPLEAGTTALVMTGAPVPQGCDCVIMREQSRIIDSSLHRDRSSELVCFDLAEIPRPGRNLARRGSEFHAGDLLIEAGVRLDPVVSSIAATVGCDYPRIVPRPSVSIVPTGNELFPPRVNPGRLGIRESNGTLLSGFCLREGFDASVQPISRDEPKDLCESFEYALSRADVVLICGGVSAGDLDLVPETLEKIGVERVFHKVSIKPGKPIWFGTKRRAKPQRDTAVAHAEAGPDRLVFGLPGNPVSGLVCFLEFVLPALRKLAGRPDKAEPKLRLPLLTRFDQRGDRTSYHPARLVRERPDDHPNIRTLAWKGSADMLSVAQAEGFAIFPPGDRIYQEGDRVDFLPIHT
jgi:molybdopterin molybdotransferase